MISHAHSDHFGLLRYIHPNHSYQCHAFSEDIKKMIAGLTPKEIVPIHTFCPEAFYQFHNNITLRRDGVPFTL